MVLKEKERTVIEDLQTQEKCCVEKYAKYAEQAKDPELKKLFETLKSIMIHFQRCFRELCLSVIATILTDAVMSLRRPTMQ